MKSDKADTDMSAAAQSDTRWNMVADSPDGDEQVWAVGSYSASENSAVKKSLLYSIEINTLN